MGEDKKIRKQIGGLRAILETHHRKIERELEKPNPDFQLISKWRKDITGFDAEIAKRDRKLPGRRRK